jgi:hypothetical protein
MNRETTSKGSLFGGLLDEGCKFRERLQCGDQCGA